MNKNIYRYAIVALSVLMPAVALAQTGTKNLSYIAQEITGYLNQALVLLMSLAIIFFVWYVIKYYIKPNDERAQAGQYVLYSLIGFFVILSIWGLVNVLTKTFGLENNAPTLQTINGLFPGGSTAGSSSSFNPVGGSSGDNQIYAPSPMPSPQQSSQSSLISAPNNCGTGVASNC